MARIRGEKEHNRKDAPGRRYSLRLVLATAFGTLVALAVAFVLVVSVSANFRNTFSLLNDQAVALLAGMERAIKREIEPVVETTSTLASLYANGDFRLDDARTSESLVSALLRMRGGAEGIFLYDMAGNKLEMIRAGNGEPVFAGRELVDTANVDAFRAAALRSPGAPAWARAIAMDGRIFHAVAQTLIRDGRVEGIVVAIIGRLTINRIVAELGRDNNTTAFVMTADRQIIAHSRMPQFFRQTPVAPIAEFPDSILAALGEAEPSLEFNAASELGIEVFETPGRDGTVYITKALSGYAQQPYVLGAYFDKTDIGEEVFRAVASLLAGLAGLLLAVVAAVMIGKRISRPMTRIAETAALFSDFRIDEMQPLPKSRIREIDDQARALNKLQIAMREFSRYVPRSVVAGLIASGSKAALPREREITILFTDIADFTGLSERLEAHETASLLSEHFDLIGAEIESRNGTVDKFMGDGLMAFWGAPEDNPDHVADAVESARAIARALARHNAQRRRDGLPPLKMRLGLHTGKAVVGNIGGATRQNYTIVGDAVNVAQRLEQLGKELLEPGDEIVATVSSDIAEAAGDRARFEPAGTRVIRGRERPVAVCRLVLDDASVVPKIVAFPGASSA